MADFAKKALAPKEPKPAKEPRVRKPKEVKPIELAIPQPVEGIDRWIIFGLDPSLSRTGYGIMLVERGEDRSTARWLEVGSFSPESSSDPAWVRSKAVALAARGLLHDSLQKHFELKRDPVNPLYFDDATREWLKHTGLIVSMEAPTPGNDFLNTISIILRLILFEKQSVVEGFPDAFGRVQVQFTNAATLRRLMGLVQRGNKNKKENVERAYTFLDKGSYPNLDTDACDGVLMGMMARYSAAILMGYPNTIPERFLIALCDATVEVVGKLHRVFGVPPLPGVFTCRRKKALDRKNQLRRINHGSISERSHIGTDRS